MRVIPFCRRPVRRVRYVMDNNRTMSFISTLRGQGETRTRFVFSAFVVMWLSLMLQPCSIAATMPVEMSAHAAVNVQLDGTPSDSDQVNGHKKCPLTSAAGECCCGTSGIYKGSEASKRSLTHKNDVGWSDCISCTFVSWTAPDSIFAGQRLANAGSAEVPPAGSPINIRNCVYLI